MKVRTGNARALPAATLVHGVAIHATLDRFSFPLAHSPPSLMFVCWSVACRVGVVFVSLQTLSSTTRNVRAAKKICRNRDTIHTLLDALKTKPKFTKMVEYSLECLKNLAVDEVSVEEMMDEGTLEVLLNVMKLNPYNEKIQQMVHEQKQNHTEE